MKASLKGIIFDLDGTLLNTLEDIADAMNLTLTEYNLPQRPQANFGSIVGGGAEDIARRLLPPEQQSREAIMGFVERFRSHYRKNWKAKTQFYDGMPELIKFLMDREFRLGVLSNKPQEFVLSLAGEFLNHGQQIFDPVWGQQSEFPVKPHPDGALSIARAWSVSPGQIGFMGDSDVDMQTAKNAGMLALGAAWGFRSIEELERSGADVVLHHPLDLIHLIT